MNDPADVCDPILSRAVTGERRVPGVVACVTDRHGDVYRRAAGERRLGGEAMSEDTVFAIFSTTKAITGTTALQCVEEGLLDLDAPAAMHAPAVGELMVIEGFDDAGRPILRPPRSAITTRQLMLHAAGLGCDVFAEDRARLAGDHGQPSVTTGRRAALATPSVFDPGEPWQRGFDNDWVGQVVEGVRGRRLGEVMAERVFEPLGMHDVASIRTESMRTRTAALHARGVDDSLIPLDDPTSPDDPEIHMGGRALYGTVPDYMKFIRMWLNDGAGPSGPVLRPDTVAWAVKGGLGGSQMATMLRGVDRTMSNDAEFFPGIAEDRPHAFKVDAEPAPIGRPAESLGRAGLANCFFWIDRHNGIGGYWATQILPFGDPVSFPAFLEFEAAIYRALAG